VEWSQSIMPFKWNKSKEKKSLIYTAQHITQARWRFQSILPFYKIATCCKTNDLQTLWQCGRLHCSYCLLLARAHTQMISKLLSLGSNPAEDYLLPLTNWKLPSNMLFQINQEIYTIIILEEKLFPLIRRAFLKEWLMFGLCNGWQWATSHLYELVGHLFVCSWFSVFKHVNTAFILSVCFVWRLMKITAKMHMKTC